MGNWLSMVAMISGGGGYYGSTGGECYTLLARAGDGTQAGTNDATVGSGAYCGSLSGVYIVCFAASNGIVKQLKYGILIFILLLAKAGGGARAEIRGQFLDGVYRWSVMWCLLWSMIWCLAQGLEIEINLAPSPIGFKCDPSITKEIIEMNSIRCEKEHSCDGLAIDELHCMAGDSTVKSNHRKNFTGPDGNVVISTSEINHGEELFHLHGMMSYGSCLGDGSERGPDYTAEASHQFAVGVTKYYSNEMDDSKYINGILINVIFRNENNEIFDGNATEPIKVGVNDGISDINHTNDVSFDVSFDGHYDIFNDIKGITFGTLTTSTA